MTTLDRFDDVADYLTDDERRSFADLFTAYPDDDELASHISAELRALRIRNAVRAVESAEGFTPPPRWPGSVAEQLAGGVPEIDWLIEGLIPNGNVQLNAQWKAGKTTFAMNLVESLLADSPFLGRFRPVFGREEHVGFLNMELDRNMFLKWLEPYNLDDSLQKRLHVYHAREAGFGRPNLRHPRGFQWMAEWLTSQGITFLVIDPVSALFMPGDWPGGGDINMCYLQFWDRLEELKRKAGLRAIFLTNHTGVSESSSGRARGAAAMMDKPDVNIAYRHDGEQGGERVGNKNYMKPEGRIDAIDELELELSPRTKRLRVSGGGSKDDAKARSEAVRLWLYLKGLHEDWVAKGSGDPDDLHRPIKGEVFGAMGWPQTGKRSDETSRWYECAKLQRWVKTTRPSNKGTGAILHEIGPEQPTDAEIFLARGGGGFVSRNKNDDTSGANANGGQS